MGVRERERTGEPTHTSFFLFLFFWGVLQEVRTPAPECVRRMRAA